jgi:hypothetical protein
VVATPPRNPDLKLTRPGIVVYSNQLPIRGEGPPFFWKTVAGTTHTSEKRIVPLFGTTTFSRLVFRAKASMSSLGPTAIHASPLESA